MKALGVRCATKKVCRRMRFMRPWELERQRECEVVEGLGGVLCVEKGSEFEIMKPWEVHCVTKEVCTFMKPFELEKKRECEIVEGLGGGMCDEKGGNSEL